MNNKKYLVYLLLLVSLGSILLYGCGITNPKPVTLSPEFRAQVQSAVMVMTELELRFETGANPNDCKFAMKTAKESLQIILDADAGGIR